MRNWKYRVELGSFYHDDAISIEQKGKLVATQIKLAHLTKIDTMMGDDFEDVIDHFNSVAECEETTAVEEFDEAMEQLYDMADTYDIWINTKK